MGDINTCYACDYISGFFSFQVYLPRKSQKANDGLQFGQEQNDGFEKDFSKISTLVSLCKGQSRKEKPSGDLGLAMNPKPSAAQSCSYPSMLPALSGSRKA